MKNLARTLGLTISLAALFGLAAPALAFGPVLSVSNNGSNISITVSGANPYSSIQLAYTSPGSSLPTTISNFGTTDGSGYFVTSVSQNSYGISSGVSMYVTVGGQQSNIVIAESVGGCTYNCGNLSGLSLSQTSLNLNVGQTASVTAYNYSGGNLYVSSNSNSSVVSATVSGSQINFYALASGSSTVSICSNYASACASVYVTAGNVLGATTYAVSIQDNYFSPNSITVPAGGSVTWTNLGSMAHTVTADNGAFNSGSLNSGSAFNFVFGTAGTYYYHCVFHGATGNVGMSGVIYVTGSEWNGGNLTFSQSAVNLSLNQSSSVNIYGGYSGSSYYISSNSNSSVASASISGSTLYLYAGNIGSSAVNVCQSGSSSCGSVYVTVGGTSGCTYNCGTGNLSLSQTSVNLSVGQTVSVTAYNYSGGNLYVSSNSNPAVVSATVSGSRIDFYGLSYGNSTVSICSNYSGYSSGNCASVYVTVGGGLSGSGVSLSQTTLNLNVGQSSGINIYGGSGYGYYVAQNSNPAVVMASQNGSVLNVYGGQAGNSVLRICQNNASSCASLYVTVGGGYSSGGGSVLGASIYGSGQLINDGGTVYIIYKNTKTAFTSAAVFRALGFMFTSVISGSTAGLNNSGYVIRTAAAAHPWGSWIKSGNTVYFVHESGLIPIGDYGTFLNNGGNDSLVVPANIYDFQLPMLSVMTANDYRLR